MHNSTFPQKFYLPDRLKSQLAQIPRYPLTVVEAPAGVGKTTAVREFLKETVDSDARQYWYTCLSENLSVSWAGICDLFSNLDSEMGKNLAKFGFPTPDTLTYITACFRDLKCLHETYVVIDNFHLLRCDILQDIVGVASMHGIPKLHLVLISQPVGLKNQLFHNANVYTVDSSAFFFDRESTAQLLKNERIRLSDEELNHLYAITEGWISAIKLQISSYKLTGSFDYTADIDHLVETAIWNRLTPEQQDSLVALSVLDSFTPRQAAIMLGKETLPENIKNLLRDNDFIRYFPREKIYVMHSILQNFLRNQFSMYRPEKFQKKVLHTAGRCCIAEADYYAAARFFFAVKDYDAILSIPFTGKYLMNKRDDDMIGFLIKFIGECPDYVLCKYPFSLLMFSYLLRVDGEYQAFQKLCRLIEQVLESNPFGLKKEELNQLRGEYLLLTSCTLYNDMEAIYEAEQAAFALLNGASRFRLSEIPITLGATSVLSMMWSEPGTLESTLEKMQKFLPFHIQMSHGQGVGADCALQAEIMMMRGDDAQAEILCHKAIYLARSKHDTAICLCAELMLARIAILRGDVDAFLTAFENIKEYAKESSNLYILRMVDICLSAVSVALDSTEFVAKWLNDSQTIRKKVYARAVPYMNVLYSHFLSREKRYAELLALVDSTMQMAREMRYVLPQVYGYIFRARVHYTGGREQEALENLAQAFALAFPDKVYLPFAQFSFVGDLLAKTKTADIWNRHPEWKTGIDTIAALCRRYGKGRNTVLAALRQEKSPLTPREREVALLAKSRLTYQEIAEKLFISKATVRTILYNVYNKLGIHSKSELFNIDL